MRDWNWMNSPRTKAIRPVLCLLIFILALGLSGCSVNTLPEIIAGKIIKEILYRDRDLFYDENYDTADAGTGDPSEGTEEGKGFVPHPEIGSEDEEDDEYPEDEDEEEESEDDSDTEDDLDEEQDEKSYYFSVLDSDEKKVYLEIYNEIFNMGEGVLLSSSDADQVDRIFNLCMMDHPELFYCDGYKSMVPSNGDLTKRISFMGKYNCTEDERKSQEEEIRSTAEKILDGMPDDDSDYEKVKYLFEWIVDNTEYDTSSPDNQNIKSVFLNGKSVCQGYTMAMKYLLDKAGIFCTVVYGYASNQNHAWNLVKMDGTYCYVDTTWGDSSYRTGDNTSANRTSYNYFGCNTDILLRTHKITENGELPECTSLDEYYYVKEARYFTSADKDRLKAVFDHEASLGEHMFTIRASSEEVYKEIYELLFDQRLIFELVPNAESVTYIEDKDELTLTFTV